MDNKLLKQITGAAGILTLVMLAFYASGIYLNIMQIKKIKNEIKKS